VVARRIGVLCVLAAVALSAAIPASGARLRIVYTNDLHARLERLPSIAETIAVVRASADPVLLVDAGDAWHDFRVPVHAVWGADEMVEWMNRTRYDAMALGNHDLYVGWRKLQQLVSRADFPVLGANLGGVGELPLPWAGSTRVARGGLDILIVGLATVEQLPMFDMPWLRLDDPAEALRCAIAAAPVTPDLVICVAHVPLRVAEALASAVPDVDVFVTGHSHAVTSTPKMAGNALVVQSGAFGRYVGVLTIDVEQGGVRLVDNALVPTEETAATDVGRGLVLLARVALGIVALSLLLLF